MELYTKTSYELSRKLTLEYSTSFSQSSKLFHASIQNDIFAIYGFVRIADEIVDTYTGTNKANLLTQLEKRPILQSNQGIAPTRSFTHS